MHRRDFLRRASLAVAALAIAPEELVWTPRSYVFLSADGRDPRIALVERLIENALASHEAMFEQRFFSRPVKFFNV